jgi:hypothetical protein
VVPPFASWNGEVDTVPLQAASIDATVSRAGRARPSAAGCLAREIVEIQTGKTGRERRDDRIELKARS